MDEDYGDIPRIMSKMPKRFQNERTVITVESTEFTFYPDIMILSDFLVSKEVKNCLKLFEPNMEVEDWILFDRRIQSDRMYHLLKIKEYESLDRAPKDKAIFKIMENNKARYVIRQDALECIFRRGIMGATVSEIKL